MVNINHTTYHIMRVSSHVVNIYNVFLLWFVRFVIIFVRMGVRDNAVILFYLQLCRSIFRLKWFLDDDPDWTGRSWKESKACHGEVRGFVLRKSNAVENEALSVLAWVRFRWICNENGLH